MFIAQIVDDYLQKDPLLYIAISQSIKRRTAKILYAQKDGLLLLNIPSGDYHLSAENEQTLAALLPLVAPGHGLILYQPQYQELLAELGYRCARTPILLSAYLEPDITIPYIKGLRCRLLSDEYLPAVIEHYTLIPNPRYLQERLHSGIIGAFYYGELAGFAGTHDDGSLGMLEIFPQFQRKGFGSALTCHLTNLELRKGHIPYGYCFADNHASIAMQKKIGFTFASKPILMLYKQPAKL